MGAIDFFHKAIEIERDWLAYRVSKHFGVGISRVTDSGGADNAERWQVLCTQCKSLEMKMLHLFYEIEPTNYTNPTVNLLKLFEFGNNVLFYRGLVLAGQCPDCGHVYFATYIPGRKQ